MATIQFVDGLPVTLSSRRRQRAQETKAQSVLDAMVASAAAAATAKADEERAIRRAYMQRFRL